MAERSRPMLRSGNRWTAVHETVFDQAEPRRGCDSATSVRPHRRLRSPLTDDPATVDPSLEARIRRRQTVRLMMIAALVVIATALALDNLQDVTIGWVVSDTDAPLVVVLVVVFLLGLSIGWLSGRQDRTAQT